MKTIKQWLKEGLSKEDYKKAKKYKNRDWEWEGRSFKDALEKAFSWYSTKEGDDYWRKIHDNGGSLQDDPIVEEVDNNGWIKIQSVKDLPKEKGIYFVFTVDKNREMIYVDGDISVMQHTSHSWIRRYTHYQPLIKPESPKF